MKVEIEWVETQERAPEEDGVYLISDQYGSLRFARWTKAEYKTVIRAGGINPANGKEVYLGMQRLMPGTGCWKDTYSPDQFGPYEIYAPKFWAILPAPVELAVQGA